MKAERFIQKDFKKSDQYIQRVCRMFLYFIAINWLLNIFNIYDLDKQMMNVILVITAILMCIPIVLFRIWNKPHIMRYVTAFIIVVEIGIIYSITTIHTVLLFTFPLVLFSIYSSVIMNRFIMGSTIIIMLVSHISSHYFTIVPEEPFDNIGDILTYSFLPRLVQFLFFAIIIQYAVKRNQNLINTVMKYSEDMFVAQEELVRQFSEISESKSGQTGSHIKRVACYMEVLTKELELPEEEQQCVVVGSMLHDIGKLLISSEIIEKPGKLTKEEFEVIKEHVQFGYKLLQNSPGPVMEIGAKIALEHHEKWDGTGYLGIKGEEIDYHSRIMAIVDVFDALISKRSYKEKWRLEDAYEEIISQSGRHFDPEIVKVFQKCYPQLVKISEELPD
ncbi:MAG: HD-GYP domain-containing protein [Eubacteriales bacterium]